MCGIAGFVDKRGRTSPEERQKVITGMVDAIEHRGRDGTGVFVDERVALGNVRLAIIDASERGAQPFFDDERSLVLTYNGELYNFRDINRTLTGAHRLKTECDTETILYAFKDEGTKALTRFKGMFALSFLDRKKNTLTFAVDRFGIKPLYFFENDEWFAWGSEIKSFYSLPGFSPELRDDVLSEYLVFRNVAGSRTLLKGVTRLLPGQYARFDLESGHLERTTYWELSARDERHSDEEYAGLLKEKLTKSVQEHLLSDVPLGVQLSGGVDSSLVVALASETAQHLNSYSIGLEDEAWNEFRYSREIARGYGTKHHELSFTEDDFCRQLPSLTYMMDEPLAHSHSVPIHMLAKEARKDVKVLLSGEGADEVFFGYRRYQKLYSGSSPTDILFSNALSPIASVEQVYTSFSRSAIEASDRARLLQDLSSRGFDRVQQISAYDLATYLPPLLIRQDKMGMAANLENRVPFLDHELVEFGFSLPVHLKIDAKESKILLKRVAEEFLPHDLIYRKKCGFAQPLGAWLKNTTGLGRYLALVRTSARDGIDQDAFARMVSEHESGEKDHTDILWTILVLELWLRVCVEREAPHAILEHLYKLN